MPSYFCLSQNYTLCSNRHQHGCPLQEQNTLYYAALLIAASFAGYHVVSKTEQHVSNDDVFNDELDTLRSQIQSLQDKIETFSWDPKSNPVAIPPGQAKNLPSIQVEDKKLNKKRSRYGGVGGKERLGGFAKFDAGGLSLGLFKHMIQDFLGYWLWPRVEYLMIPFSWCESILCGRKS